MEYKKFKEGKYTLAAAQAILGMCYLAEIPHLVKVRHEGRQYPGMGFDPTPWYETKADGEILVWTTPAGMYLEADV